MTPDARAAKIGPYCGAVAPGFDGPELRDVLADLPNLLARGALVQGGRNQLFRCRISEEGNTPDLAVKAFGSSGGPKKWLRPGTPSKARRSWDAARRLSGQRALTPEPVAYLEGPDGRAESYFLTLFAQDRISFTEALNTLYRLHPDCEALMALLQTVADSVRALHDAGVVHRDLGNQNILLRPAGKWAWTEPMFIDLNRAHLRDEVSVRERARDISRITLPSDFLRVFFQMYYDGPVPEPFLRLEHHCRARFAWHTRTRPLRHPIRERRNTRSPLYPAPRDIWIWDERSAQAISAWTAKDRRRFHSHLAYIPVGASLARRLPSGRREMRRYLGSAFQAPVTLAGRLGVAVQLRPDTEAREVRLLETLGPIPVLVRFYHHENESAWDRTAAAIHRLRGRGHPITIALVQDRRAVLDPERWRSFLLGVLEQTHGLVEAVEIGHAINRVKWGIWNPGEYRRLMEPVAELMARYSGIDWLGPAGIDAEFPRIHALLEALPEGVRFSALSQHLYVDRRGAPENRQGRMATLEKVAAARAMATVSERCGDRLVISEVNWPLAGTGVYSPVCSPYMYPGQRVGAPNVDEGTAADYALRYVLLTLCSGLAERLFWWRLAAHGYGLVDDRAPGGWRERPAFHVLSFFLRSVGSGRFVRRLETSEGVYAWLFENDGARHVWAYAHPAPARYRPPFSFAGLRDAQGGLLDRPASEIVLTSSPVLIFKCGEAKPPAPATEGGPTIPNGVVGRASVPGVPSEPYVGQTVLEEPRDDMTE